MKCTRKCTGLLLAAALVAQVVMPGAQVEAKKASKPVLSKKTVKVKEKAKKKVTVKNAKGYKLTVKSKNKKIATVSKQGKTAFVVKGVKAGKTKVVCTAKKKKKKVTLTCTVKVDKRRGNVTQPTVSPIATNNNAGVTATPEPAVTPEPTATPEPTIAPFPETDTFSDVPYGFADASENVEKGKMEEFTYVSKTTNKTHKVLVQLPANYSQEKQYPVLYLFHGENDTESIWSDMAADQIIDNAVTFKAAEDMIVVMPNISSDKDEDVMKDFADVLKPEVEAKYSVAKERHNTAVAGYGLGGRIALNIGLSLPEQVAYMGAFAPVEGLLPYDGGNGYFNNTSFRIDEKYEDVTFLMIQKGKSDDVAGEAPDSYHKTLTDNGSECLYLEMKGAHDQELFKAGLYNFARRIFKRGTQDESIVNGFVTKVPGSATKPTTHKGKIEKIEYETETYDPGNSQKIQKWANVYLPYNYDPEKKYNILYLMHGGGENADTWIKGDNIYGDYTHNRDMLDRLFEDGYCASCIIVNPTFYRPEGAPEPSNAMDLTTLFQYELRNDLIPAVEAKYSTYAGGDVSLESLKASRMHRGFAGLSMGSNTTYHSAFFGNYDLFAWFAPYSGYFGTENGNDADADRFNKIIEEGEANGMPLGFIYCGNGSEDFALSGQLDLMQKALVRSNILVPGRNFDFVIIPGGIHDMNQWHIHLYNTLKIFFTKE
jgi:Enterochelin esterase and related enzymes